MTFWTWVQAHWAEILGAFLLGLKWIYNAWSPGVTFSQFIRALIGEVVQEAPTLPLTAEQKKVLAAAEVPHANI